MKYIFFTLLAEASTSVSYHLYLSITTTGWTISKGHRSQVLISL